MKTISAVALSALGLFTVATFAMAAELGDPAPPLQISEWVKGGPVKLADGKGKTIYVIEFWATWCPPCRASIPHLTELQKKFKDKGVVFVGISNEKLATVKKFVKQMGDKMDYVVAIDQDDKNVGGLHEGLQSKRHSARVHRGQTGSHCLARSSHGRPRVNTRSDVGGKV